jgi:hypothetical protein
MVSVSRFYPSAKCRDNQWLLFTYYPLCGMYCPGQYSTFDDIGSEELYLHSSWKTELVFFYKGRIAEVKGHEIAILEHSQLYRNSIIL